MAKHYPLNGVDLDFGRYHHRPLGARDIMVNRIMEDFMGPRYSTSDIYERTFTLDGTSHPFFAPFKRRVRDLGLDIQVLEKLLDTDHNWSFTEYDFDRLYGQEALYWSLLTGTLWPERPAPLEDIILGLVERHYLEANPSMAIWLKYFHNCYSERVPRKAAPGWRKDMISHLKTFQPFSATNYRRALYSGGYNFPITGLSNVQFTIEPNFIGAPWLELVARQHIFGIGRVCATDREIPLIKVPNLYRNGPKRSRSEPPPSSWSAASINGLDRLDRPDKYVIHYPRRSLIQLDKLSRRRSLSRTHIRTMFRDKPECKYDKGVRKKRSRPEHKRSCGNCAQPGHLTSQCQSTCGYCGSATHKAGDCQIKASNRCKCRPFPQFHKASNCYVRCSRRCGCPYTLGHHHHKNAITCSYRCCMCGIKSHSGRQCSLKKCPCGEQHLTQDCRWKVECPAKDCNFYLCHVHCRECGKKKSKDSAKQFVGRTCQDCLKNGQPVSAKAS
ncbi:hypothetical protein GGR52DRAFT_143210 [Hypoxylon sp. FL1284]|nr:hypothetical protein GGR52DRAFT_143210 [Hypoxylon sp. FL1284]